jgi:hypothetical protein
MSRCRFGPFVCVCLLDATALAQDLTVEDVVLPAIGFRCCSDSAP